MNYQTFSIKMDVRICLALGGTAMRQKASVSGFKARYKTMLSTALGSYIRRLREGGGGTMRTDADTGKGVRGKVDVRKKTINSYLLIAVVVF